MSIQYVSNNSGQTTAVLIPIEDWNQLREKYADFLTEFNKGDEIL
jgi:hypothetical protein